MHPAQQVDCMLEVENTIVEEEDPEEVMEVMVNTEGSEVFEDSIDSSNGPKYL